MTYATTTEQITSIEISFYDHEIYAASKLIARITYDHDDFVTERFVVEVNGKEVFRRSWWQKCFDDISWHYQRGTLPVQEQDTPAATTGNEIMVEIAAECENYGFELLENGIHNNHVKLGQVGCTNCQWWVIPASSGCQIECDSVMDAVLFLSIAELLSNWKPPSLEELLDKPFDELTADEWRRLREYEPASESRDLVTA